MRPVRGVCATRTSIYVGGKITQRWCEVDRSHRHAFYTIWKPTECPSGTHGHNYVYGMFPRGERILYQVPGRRYVVSYQRQKVLVHIYRYEVILIVQTAVGRCVSITHCCITHHTILCNSSAVRLRHTSYTIVRISHHHPQQQQQQQPDPDVKLLAVQLDPKALTAKQTANTLCKYVALILIPGVRFIFVQNYEDASAVRDREFRRNSSLPSCGWYFDRSRYGWGTVWPHEEKTQVGAPPPCVIAWHTRGSTERF